MLAIFETDEYGIYPSMFRIFTPGETLSETLKNFIGYSPRFYGYPFFLISALAILPLRLFLGIIDRDGIATTIAYNGSIIPIEYTAVYMLVLRQLSVLFMAIAILILIWLWTEFKFSLRAIFLFVFLGSIPAIVKNNLWLHPDSLVTLFIVLTIVGLVKDNLQFGKWFYLAAVFCGLATGTKILGLFFLPITLPAYLGAGWMQQRIRPRILCRHGCQFLLLMAAVVIIANPLLWVPQGVRMVFETLAENSDSIQSGYGGIQTQTGFFPWYFTTLKQAFGFWWLYLSVIAAALLSMAVDRNKRLLNLIILTWSLPFFGYVIYAVATGPRERFFIPILLPLLSCLGAPVLWEFSGLQSLRKNIIASVSMLIFALSGIQLSHYLKSNFDLYFKVLARESTSQELAFYRKFDQIYLSKLPENTQLTIFRSGGIYVPPAKNLNLVMRWKLTDYQEVNSINPDLILLNRKLVKTFSSPDFTRNSTAPDAAPSSFKFYQDASAGAIQGYSKILETEYGLAFKRKELKSLPE